MRKTINDCKMRNFLVLLVCLNSLFAFAQTPGTITHDNVERTYTYYIPVSTSSGPLPLVFVLHGTTQTGDAMIDITEFNALALANSFMVVYPDGIDGIWNVGLDAVGSTADDQGFIEALANRFITDFNADPQRVYSCGFSAGGYLSHKLACESSTCFAAIASVAGTMVPAVQNTCAPSFNTSIMQIHGTADFVVAFGGNSQSGLGVDELMSFWSSTYGCASDPTITALPNTNVFDLSTVDEHDFSPCTTGAELTLLKVNGGGHMWPGTSVLLSGLGTINQDISASQEIWNFFSGKSCSTVGIAEEEAEEEALQLINNPIENIAYFSGIQDDLLPYILYDLSGKLIQQGKTNGSIDLSAIAPGMYLLRINDQLFDLVKK
jgi:polyhydroxybutyrate depolymerase